MGVVFQEVLASWEEVQYGKFLDFPTNVVLCRDDKETRIWKPSTSGEFWLRLSIWLWRVHSV